MSVKKFEILEMIAKGGMAEVYRAKTTGLQGFEKEVCVKKILPHLTEDDSFVTMFINEAKLAASLNYANIVQVHDLCVSEAGEYFIVMEFVDGKDLSDVIRATQLAGREIPPAIAVHIIREVCQGLAYAHTRVDRAGAPLNITHRDMSPHNVLVSFLGEVKIVDFGIAKASSIVSQTAVGILKGKYGYMSPEQARGQPVDARSDIFNTGIVLYEMLVGERCFAGSSDFSTLNLMRNAEVTPPSSVNANVPKSLEAIVLKALSREKTDRPQTALELERMLGDWVKAEGAIANKVDLVDFLRDLFQPGDIKSVGPSTGIIEMQSVGEPKQSSLTPKNKPTPPRKSTERSESLADKKSDEAEKKAPKAAAGKKEAPAKEAPKQEPAKKADAKDSPPAEKPKKEAPAKATPAAKEAPAKAAPAAKEAPAKAAAEKPAPAAKEAPAKAAAEKPAPAAKKAPVAKKAAPKKPIAKKGPKKVSLDDKSPVGRRHLRPDEPRARSTGSKRRQAALRVVGILAGFMLLGALLGRFRTQAASQEGAFRAMELSDRSEAASELGLVVIHSEPKGLEVRLDGVRLLHPTPVAVERRRGNGPLPVELLKNGQVIHEGVVELTEDTPVVQFSAGRVDKKAPESRATGQLSLVAPPMARVTIDGISKGRGFLGPFTLSADKSHDVEVRIRDKTRTFKVKLAPGDKKTLMLNSASMATK